MRLPEFRVYTANIFPLATANNLYSFFEKIVLNSIFEHPWLNKSSPLKKKLII